MITDAELEAVVQGRYVPATSVALDTDSRTLPDLPNKPDKTNWVEKSGGLPSYINRIAKHLHAEKGMPTGRAIAVAVNTVKRWCRSGSVTEGGKGRTKGVSAKTKALACKAVAQWEAKKAATKLNASADAKEKLVNLDGTYVLQSDADLILSITQGVDEFDESKFQMFLSQERSRVAIETPVDEPVGVLPGEADAAEDAGHALANAVWMDYTESGFPTVIDYLHSNEFEDRSDEIWSAVADTNPGAKYDAESGDLVFDDGSKLTLNMASGSVQIWNSDGDVVDAVSVDDGTY